MRDAAGWLAELHTSPLRVGPPDDATRVLYSLARRAMGAVERHPQLAAPTVELVSELERRGNALAGRAPTAMVQTHGRYHCDHVFATAETATVVDLARAAPADPAKDVAEFLTRFRIEALKKAMKKGHGDDIADLGMRVFLEEYQRLNPQPLFGLLFYWSATLLVMMLHDVLKPHLDEEAGKARLALFAREFHQLPDVVTDLGWQARSSG